MSSLPSQCNPNLTPHSASLTGQVLVYEGLDVVCHVTPELQVGVRQPVCGVDLLHHLIQGLNVPRRRVGQLPQQLVL